MIRLKRSAKAADANQKSSRHNRKWRSFYLGIALLLLAVVALAQNRNKNYQLCVPLTTWYGNPSGPTIDGNVEGDQGWRGAFRYVFGNGTSSPDVIVQGIRDTSNTLYISVEGKNLDTLSATADPSTLVVLAFDPAPTFDPAQNGNYVPGNPANYQRIDVYPVLMGAAASYHGNVQEVDYWHDASTWSGTAHVNNWSPSAPIPGAGPNPTSCTTSRTPGQACIQVAYPSPNEWDLEMALPITGDPTTGLVIPSSGAFGLFIDVFRVVNGAYRQTNWPLSQPVLPVQTCGGSNNPACEPGCAQVGSCLPDNETPSASSWGNSTIDTHLACGGVSVGEQNNQIRTSNTPNSKICEVAGVTTSQYTCPSLQADPNDPTNPNVFFATIQNSMVDGTGAPQTAHQVKATFFYADWGIPSIYDQIPAGNNPTPPIDLGAGGTEVHTARWYPLPSNIVGDAHRCVQVQLDSTQGSNTIFTSNSATQNMDFVSASKFERMAVVSAKGYPARPDNTLSGQDFDIAVTTKQEAHSTCDNNKTASAQSAGTAKGCNVQSQLTWVAEGCRHTGTYLTIKNQKLELCDGVGAFGFVVRHVGPSAVSDWQEKLAGAGLTKLPGEGNTYRLHVPQDGVATVSTAITPVTACTKLPGAASLFSLGVMFLVGLLVYRPRKRKERGSDQQHPKVE